ncbi:MAG: undecaprenyl-diphosphate phosphatase [Stackebrandtia sp.]
MELWQAFLLGIVEGLTELLPISSTGHLTVVEDLLGMKVDDPGVTGFTAFIQVGAIFSVLIYFAGDIWRIVKAFVRGTFSAEHRDFDYRFGWYVIIGSVPIVVVGLVFKDFVSGELRNMWYVAIGAIVWSFVIWFAEYAATHQRTERQVTAKDAIIIGLVQCLSLVPGVSRAGSTMAAGLLRDFDRVTTTRLTFFLGIPALTGAGVLEAKDALTGSVELAPLIVGTVVSGVVAYASVAWLLKFVSKHTLMPFVWYRIAFGVVVIGLLATGVVAAK